MLAAVVEQPGKLVVKDVPMPEMTPDHVLVRVQAASICNATDNHILHGIFDGYHDYYPQILGHEVCGEVVETGARVTQLKVGQRIVMYTPKGSFCEYISFAPKDMTYGVVADHVPSRVATCCEMFDGAYISLVYPARIARDEHVLVVGTGPMGLTAIACARQYAKTVSAVDLSSFRLSKAREMGADFTYDHSAMTQDEIIAQIMENTGPVDVLLMCIAEDRSEALDAYDLGVRALRENGRMTSLVVAVKNVGRRYRVNPFPIVEKNIKFRHFLNPNEIPRQDIFQRAVDFVADGKIDLSKLITHEVCLDEAEAALKLCDEHLDEVIKVVVYPRLSGK